MTKKKHIKITSNIQLNKIQKKNFISYQEPKKKKKQEV